MEHQAAQLGADAVVGIDMGYETVANNVLMVSVQIRRLGMRFGVTCGSG